MPAEGRKIGSTNKCKEGQNPTFPLIGIGLMYLPKNRTTIIPLATPIPPALLSYCISNNYQILIKYSYFNILESNLKIMKQEVFIAKKCILSKNTLCQQKDKNCCFDSSNQTCQHYWQEITAFRSYLPNTYFTFVSKVQIFWEGHKFLKKYPTYFDDTWCSKSL